MNSNFPNIVLGGAQLGIPAYGILNGKNTLNHDNTKKILEKAAKLGIHFIDTARDYIDSEFLIGDFIKKNKAKNKFKLITKLSHFKDEPSFHSDYIYLIEESIKKSQNLLGTEIEFLLLHDTKYYSMLDGKIWDLLLEFKEKNIIKDLGVSVQSPHELVEVINDKNISLIQMPFNILDWRWLDIMGIIEEEKKSRELIIHVRSVFLQGILLTSNINLWKKANCKDGYAVYKKLLEYVNRFERENIMDLCVSFVKSHNWIDGLVLGVNSPDQLVSNLKFITSTNLTYDQINLINEDIPKLTEKTLDPSYWSKD